MPQAKQDLEHYLETGELRYDPNDNPKFIHLLKDFLERTFSPLEREYTAQRKIFFSGTNLPNLSPQDITQLTYNAILETFPEAKEHKRKEEVLRYALTNFGFMSLEQLIEEIPKKTPTDSGPMKRYNIFGDVVRKGTCIYFGGERSFESGWDNYMFMLLKHLNSFSLLDEAQQTLLEQKHMSYGARYDDGVEDPQKPFRIYAFRAPLEDLKRNPVIALGLEVSQFSHEVVHFFQHYLVPQEYAVVESQGHTDIISTAVSSLIAFNLGLDPSNEHFFKLPEGNHYRVGAEMALRCKDAANQFQKLREEIDRYIAEAPKNPRGLDFT